MTKTQREELAQWTLEELTTFLRDGTINEDEIADTLNFTRLNIDDFDRLKRIHFVLSSDVVDYVRQLPQRLRSISRESTRERVTGREIEGKIDWGHTTKLRYTDSYGDETLFAYKTPQLEYDIPENLVLKKLLSVIYTTVTDDIEHIDYSWRQTAEWDGDLIEQMKSIFQRNVHVGRIRDAAEIDISSRDLESARQSRMELYQEAYRLYYMYDKLCRNQIDDDVEELLLNTLVIPEETYTLFELFSVFRLVRFLDGGMELQPIEKESDNDEIALMQDESSEIRVYHDKSGNFEFYEKSDQIDEDDVEEEYLKKFKHVLDEHERGVGDFLGKEGEESLFRGRPDIVVEKRSIDSNELEFAILGEVKYTREEQTFSKGLKELLEYMKYGKDTKRKDIEDAYLEEETNLMGVIITDGVETEKDITEVDPSVENKGDNETEYIVHLTTDDLSYTIENDNPEPLTSSLYFHVL
jgi:hypothetical protein